MNKLIQSKILMSNDLEDLVEYDGRFFVVPKKQKICVIPYTLSGGMLDKIGVVKYSKSFSSNLDYSLVAGMATIDDDLDLVTANRLLFEHINSNVPNANNWMYLGKIKNNVIDNLGVSLYSVNITDVKITTPTKIDREKKEYEFKLVYSNDIISTDDSLLLASYLRLFQFFYINSLNK